MNARIGVACLTALLLVGCATKRYGRAIPVGDAEKRLLTCDQIDLEIAKNDAFMKQTTDSAKFSGKDALAFMGDFGIGNNMEYKDAMKSGTDRAAQLSQLKIDKNCSKTLITPPR